MRPTTKHGCDPREAWRRLRDSERGQGLVEYALIIVVVSLGTIAALTFLRDNIRGLFSAAGSSIALGDGASGSGGGSPPPPSAPPNGTAISAANTTARSNVGTSPLWRTTAFSCTVTVQFGVFYEYHCSTPFAPPQGGGLFVAPFAGGADGSACSFTFSNGYAFNGHWQVATLPVVDTGLPAWHASSDPNLGTFGSPDYGAACL